MAMRADQSSDWQEGLKKLLADEGTGDEQKRLLRICGDKLGAAATALSSPSTLELESALRCRLRADGLSGGYINNLMSTFYRVIAAAPKTTLHHEKATAWRAMIDRYNEKPFVMHPAVIEYVVAWITASGLDLRPLTQDDLMAFTNFLESRGLNPFESGTRYRRELRKILCAASLYHDNTVKHSYDLPPMHQDLLKKMEVIATAPHRKTWAKINLLADDFGKAKEPIRAVTWKKNKRAFIRYLTYQLTRGFDDRDWISIAHWKEIIGFVMAVNEENPMAPATAASLVTSLIACLHHLRALGYLKLSDDEFKRSVTDELWPRIDKFEAYFEKGGRLKLDLPTYEKLYRRYYDNVLSDFKKIRKSQSPRMLRSLVLAIFAVEFGWRPEDLKNTLRFEHVKRYETLSGEKFYFVRYQPSKTNHGKSSMYASCALPPWFNEIFDLYFESFQGKSPKAALFPLPKMSSRISQLSFRYLGEKYSANSYRKMLASFFSRHKIPGLYMITGRVADKRLELITEIEMSHYAEAATSEETLLEIRFGENIRKILRLDDLSEAKATRLRPKVSP